MSNLDKLLAKGAQVVGGDLILRHKVMGQFRHGDFFVTPEGMEELEILDVEVKETKPTKAKKAVAAPAPTGDDITVDV